MSRRTGPPRRSVLTLPLAAGLVSALSGCAARADPGLAVGVGSTTRASQVVRLGLIPIIDVAPIYLGLRKGFFARRGIELRPVVQQSGADIVKGVLAGDLDVGFSNIVSLLLARERGRPVIAIEGGVSSSGVDGYDGFSVMVPKGSDLSRPRDLVGLRVAVNAVDNVGDTTVRASVTKDGGDDDGLEFIEVPFPAMTAALADGTVDAAWVTEPFVTAIKAAGGRVLFDSLRAVHPKLQVAAYFTTSTRIAEDRVGLTRFKSVLGDCLLYARDHQVEVREILGTYTKIPRDLAASVALPDWPVGTDRGSALAIGQAARQFGTLTADPDVEGLMGFSL